jgi:hypothetical protein
MLAYYRAGPGSPTANTNGIVSPRRSPNPRARPHGDLLAVLLWRGYARLRVSDPRRCSGRSMFVAGASPGPRGQLVCHRRGTFAHQGVILFWRHWILGFNSRCHSHQHLAEVLTLQQTEKRCGRLLQSLDDVLAIFEATRAYPFADIAQKIGLFRGEIRDDEPA